MGFEIEVVEYNYICDTCSSKNPAESELSKDRPEGYFVFVRRVTEAKKHHVSDELYFCDKDCLLNFMQYGISNNTQRVEPIQ